MILSSKQRKQIMLTQEGWALSNVSDSGADGAAEICRAQVDGHFNALMRLQGRESAARFAFALSDRVAGGIEDPTDYRELVEKPVLLIDHDFVEPAKRSWRWRSYAWGFFHGMIALGLMTFWRLH